jgi:hypothetical protein
MAAIRVPDYFRKVVAEVRAGHPQRFEIRYGAAHRNTVDIAGFSHLLIDA